MEKYREKNMTKEILDLIQKTEKIDLIPRYYIIDAVLAKNFKITIEEAIYAWKQELRQVAKIHKRIKELNIPRMYKCAQFALQVLKHLLLRGTSQVTCSYAYGATNFIVALVKSNQCLCFSYTMYVQACAEFFGYDDYVQTCSISEHIYTIIKQSSQDSEFFIAIDAGLPNNSHILVISNQNHKELESILDWDQNVYAWADFVEQDTICQEMTYKVKENNYDYLLFLEASSKKSFKNILRNYLILTYIAPNATFIKDCLEFALGQQELYKQLFHKSSTFNIQVLDRDLAKLLQKIKRNKFQLGIPRSTSVYIFYALQPILPGINQGLEKRLEKWDFVYELFKLIYQCLYDSKYKLLDPNKVENSIMISRDVSKNTIVKSQNMCFVEVIPMNEIKSMMVFENGTIFYKTNTLHPKSKLITFKSFDNMTSKYIVYFYNFKNGKEPNLLTFDQVFK